jgi:hypothetical protein
LDEEAAFMKNYRTTLLLLAVLAVLGGCYFYLTRVKPFEVTREIFQFKEGSVAEITITSPDGKIKFSRQGRGWAMVEPSPYAIDQNKLLRLEIILDKLTALRIVAKEEVDLSKYGLDHPALSIDVTLKNGETRTLLVGAETVSQNEYYAAEPGKKLVYTVYNSDISVFKGNPSSFRDRNFFTVDRSNITTLQVITTTQEYTLAPDSKGKWQFTSPVVAQVKGDAVKDILEKVAGLKIDGFIAGKPGNSSQYGLDKPSLTVTIGDKKGKTQTIYFGKEDAGKQSLYFRVTGSDEIYTISSEAFKPANMKLGELINEAPLSIGIGDVNRVVITDNGRVVEFPRDASKKEDIFTLAGKHIKNEDFITLYINLMALSSEGYDPGNEGKVPEFTVVYELKNHKNIKAAYSRRDETSYFINVNGKPLPFYVGARKIELARKWLKRIELP